MIESPAPLSVEEERAWRALMRLLVRLPRAIDEDLLRRSGLSLTRYVVLMRLSETPGHAQRMSDLAESASISASRMTRIVQSMVAEGLVTRRPVTGDARASQAVLTAEGLRRLQTAWPAHLAGVRALFLDHIEPAHLGYLGREAERLLDAIEASLAGPTCAGQLPIRTVPEKERLE